MVDEDEGRGYRNSGLIDEEEEVCKGEDIGEEEGDGEERKNESEDNYKWEFVIGRVIGVEEDGSDIVRAFCLRPRGRRS